MSKMTNAAWIPYFSTIAAAAAALTGLIFVAVSINLSPIVKQAWLADRAAESLMQLLGALLVATFPLIPQQPLLALGVEVLATAALLWSIQTRLQVQYLRVGLAHPLHWGAVRVVQTQLAYVPFFVGGTLLLFSDPREGFYCMVAGLTFSMLAGVYNAWVLLVEILR
jgi:modulator of FtsH protease